MKIIQWIVGLLLIVGAISLFAGWFDNAQPTLGIGVIVIGISYLLFATNFLKSNRWILISSYTILFLLISLLLIFIGDPGNFVFGYTLWGLWIILGLISLVTLLIGMIKSLFEEKPLD